MAANWAILIQRDDYKQIKPSVFCLTQFFYISLFNKILSKCSKFTVLKLVATKVISDVYVYTVLWYGLNICI